MASSDIRLTREQIAAAMLQACKEAPCYTVQAGGFGKCSICPNRKVKK